MSHIQRVAVVGCGVIGASWASLFLARGLFVRATDPAPGAEATLRTFVEDAWPALVAIADAPSLPPWERLTFSDDLAATVMDADLVQENGPERIAFKHQLYQDLDAAAPPHAILASSSSGLRMADIQHVCSRHPERTLIAHPFNPPHLIPLVELAGGPATGIETMALAKAFYEQVGKKVIVLRKEIIGHVANRLQAAIFREVTHLVTQGVVSVEDADAAVRYGPGLRWSVMGQCMLYSLGAGEAGFAAFFEKFGPSIEAWWDDLGDPRLDEATCAVLTEGVAEQMRGRSMRELMHMRDALLIARLQADRDHRQV